MVKLLTMSVWGDNPRYIYGAKAQVRLASEFYPDFKTLIYTDNATNFLGMKPWWNVDIIERKDDNGVFWRFEPLFDSDQNIVIVRDSDGRITHREAKAVKEWLQSDKKFHTFRDHESHFEYPIIACAFGYKGRLPDQQLSQMMAIKSQPFYYTNDQVYLRDFVWPIVKDDSMVHECTSGWFKYSREKLKNRYSFCGNGYDQFDMPLYPPTLMECQGFNPSAVDVKYKFDKGLLLDENIYNSTYA
jgi:protein O-GlcNAc transferase